MIESAGNPCLRTTIAIACFFLSGLAGLVYEIVWIKRATLVFGSTTAALSAVLAVFFLGLSLGSELFGRVSWRVRRPMRLFAALELGAAAFALASLLALDALESVYGFAYRAWGGRELPLFLVRLGLVALALAPTTLLMGGTLPLFCRHFAVHPDRIASSVGALYAVNTLGAAVGCALAGFWLLPTLGLLRTALVGAGASVVAGCTVAALRLPPTQPVAPEAQRSASGAGRAALRRDGATLAALFFLVGAVGFANEILWARFLSLIVFDTVYTVTLALAVVLLGIVLGSAFVAPIFDRTRSPSLAFGAISIAMGLSVELLLLLPSPFWQGLAGIPSYGLLLLPAAVLSGAAFPLVVRIAVVDPRFVGLAAGRMAAVNMVGGVAGSLAMGFLVLPRLGLQNALLLVTGVSVATGVAAWLLLDRARETRGKAVALAGAVLLWWSLPTLLGTRLPDDYLAGSGTLVASEEGRASTLSVIREGEVLRLESDRRWQGQDRIGHQALAAHIPMFLHPDARDVLVVGVGAGQTPGRFLMHDVELVECVDIEPAVFAVIEAHFESDWLHDPRVRIVPEDGRSHLAHTARSFDVISLEVGQIHRPGVASFYTRDFYELARARLEPGGLLSQFVPLAFFEPDEFRSVVRTFLEVFPVSVLWYNSSELLLLGANGDELPLHTGRWRELLRRDPIRADLDYAYWGGRGLRLGDPGVFLAGFLVAAEGLAALATGAELLTDDRPRLEYATAGKGSGSLNELVLLPVLRERLTPLRDEVARLFPEDAPGALRRVTAIRDRNLDDIAASALVRNAVEAMQAGDAARASKLLTAALDHNPGSFDATLALAEVRRAQARLAEAQALYLRALRMRGDSSAAHQGLGTALYQADRCDEAIPHLRAALAGWPGDAETHNTLGAALARTGRLRQAQAHFLEALRLRPGFADAESNLLEIDRAQTSVGR